ncbi:MAG: glycosyltransferase [Candidatus Aegiribacteria sp.]|nr:glycosyltransferase [Candidatus Aegiribacteria sp.]
MNRIPVDFVISSLNRGGAENKLVAVANGLDRNRFSARVCLLKKGPLVQKLKVPYEGSIIPSKYSIHGIYRLIKLFRKNNTQIVWVVGNGDAGFFGRIAARIAHVPVVIQSLHATGRPGGKHTIDFWNGVLDKISVFTDQYVAVANAHKQYLVEREGIDSKKMVVIHNGVDTNSFSQGDPDAYLLDAWGIPADVPIVGIVGGFKPEKRHDLFLEAGKVLRKTHPEIHFLIVGDGTMENSVKDEVNKLGMLEAVHFTGGLNDVAPAYRLMRVCVLCSDMEAFPNVVLESMATGIPVISTDVGSVREAIINEQTGLVVPPDDSEALANGISRLLSDKELRKTVITAARQHVVDNFSLRNMIRKREKLFEELLKKKYSG